MASASSYPAMTPSAYSAIQAGTYNVACFAEYKNGNASVEGGTVLCGKDGVGGLAHYCSGMTRQDTVGISCRSMCKASTENETQCQDAAQSYCNTHMGNPECACLQPQAGLADGVTWGEGENAMSYAEFKTFVANNPGISSVEALCFWPPCSSSVKTSVFQNPQLEAPNVCPNSNTVSCVIKNVNVSVSNVKANNISIVQQKCGSFSSSSTSNSKTTVIKPDLFQSLTLLDKLAIGGGILLLLAVIIVIIVVAHRMNAYNKTVSAAAKTVAIAAALKAKAAAKAKAVAKGGTKATAKTVTKTATKAGTKSTTKTATKTVTKAGTKSTAKTATKTVAKAGAATKLESTSAT